MSIKYCNSVLLKGSIKSKIVYKLSPSTEFSEGVWNLSLASISYSTSSTNNIKDIYSITCNVIKGQKFSVSNEVETYDQTLNIVVIDTSLQKNTIYFNSQWFHINAISNEIKFVFKNETTTNDINSDISVYLHVIFQKVI
jgi:hypothetical protein